MDKFVSNEQEIIFAYIKLCCFLIDIHFQETRRNENLMRKLCRFSSSVNMIIDLFIILSNFTLYGMLFMKWSHINMVLSN